MVVFLHCLVDFLGFDPYFFCSIFCDLDNKTRTFKITFATVLLRSREQPLHLCRTIAHVLCLHACCAREIVFALYTCCARVAPVAVCITSPPGFLRVSFTWYFFSHIIVCGQELFWPCFVYVIVNQ